MKLVVLPLLLITNLINHPVFSGRIIQCEQPKVINAFISCSTDPLPNGNYVNLTRCSIICKDGYVRISGPPTIDCYRRNWLHGGNDHVSYSKPTECGPKLPLVITRPVPATHFGRSARLLRLGIVQESKHDGMCSNSYCRKRYSGITKGVCLRLECCWNQEKRDCYGYLQDKCQIRKSERSRCKGTWKGMSLKQCEMRNCCYDSGTGECYSSKSGILGTQVIPVLQSKESTDPASPGRCALKIAERSRCPGTWSGITKSACLKRNCCYDPKTKGSCYVGRADQTTVAQTSTPFDTTSTPTDMVPETIDITTSQTTPDTVEPTASSSDTTTTRLQTKSTTVEMMSEVASEDVCEISPEKRTPCTEFDIPRFLCLAFECCFDVDKGQCFSAKSKSSSARNLLVPRVPSAPRPIDVTTKACDLEIDLSNGKVTYADKSKGKYFRITEKPRAPVWSSISSSGQGGCDFQSVIEIQIGKMKSLSLRMKYGIPSRQNFHITTKSNVRSSGKSFWAEGYHLKGIKGFSGSGVIPSKSDVMFWFKQSRMDIIFRGGTAKDVHLPVNFEEERTIKVGLNRAVFLNHAYDIAKMGSGVCKFCLAYI